MVDLCFLFESSCVYYDSCHFKPSKRPFEMKGIEQRSVIFVLLCLPLQIVSLFGFNNNKYYEKGIPLRRVHSNCLSCPQSFVSHLVSHLRAGSDTVHEADETDEENLNPVVLFDPDEGDDATGRPRRAIILMDGFCRYHGIYLASQVQQMAGTAIIPVLSNYLYEYLIKHKPENVREYQRMRLPQTTEQILQWKQRLPPEMELVGVYCESDSGLADAEILRQVLQVSGRDEPDQLEARRNKYLMQELIRDKTDLPVVQQRLCENLSDAQTFAQQLFAKGHEYVVVKPFRGVASESVSLCCNPEQVAEAFNTIKGSSVFGSRQRHDSVLVQEFLVGQEYAIDIVSRNGNHKIAAVWRYDKRPANGASFCYFQTRLVDISTDPAVSAVCAYATRTLDALGVRYGFSHNEIIVTSDRGPMLVEVNCRQHNMDFAPLTVACIGYNALYMTMVALLGDDDDWNSFPDSPVLRGHGCMVHLVNYAQGRLQDVHFLDEMSSLGSFLDGEVYEHFLIPGQEIKPTVDIRSDAGWVQLINEDEDELCKDYQQIVDWMPTMFQVE